MNHKHITEDSNENKRTLDSEIANKNARIYYLSPKKSIVGDKGKQVEIKVTIINLPLQNPVDL